jgi:hypothetical protein
MENGQKTLNELFDGKKIFCIPSYQRAFAWEEKQLTDFIEDIKNQAPGKDYFMGTILFQKNGSEGFFDKIDIVDGQQRITTLIIFMNCIIESFKKNNYDIDYIEMLEETYIKYRSEYKLRVLDDDNEFFRSYILSSNKVTDDLIKTPSQQKLLNAKKFFTKRLQLLKPDKIKEYIDKVNKTKILTYSVLDKAEATLIFETTNDRGKSLTNLEKTKSFLMYKLYFASEDPESHLSDIQSRFSEMYRDYEEIENEIDEDTILQHHFIAFEDWKVKKSEKDYQKYVQIVKNKVNDLINEEKDPHKTLLYIDKYSRELRESFSLFNQLFKFQNEYLHGIWILGRTRLFYPLLIKSLKLDHTKNKKNFISICRLIEIFSFRVYGILNRPANTGESQLYAFARDFEGNYDELFVQLKSTLDNYAPDKEFKNRLESRSFYHDVSSTDRNYFFWKYENYLRSKNNYNRMSEEVFYEEDPKKRLTIEHILPQNPDEKLIIVKDKKIIPKYTEKFIEEYLHSLGNLTIDPLSPNVKKSNNDFEIKNSKYFQKAPLMCQNELEDFLNKKTNKYDEESIDNRIKTLTDFALKEWNYQKI